MSSTDTYPKCPQCRKESFTAVKVDNINNSDKALAFITCSDPECGYPVAIVPFEHVWEE